MLGGDTTTSAEFAALLDLLGRRWTLRLIWELRAGGLPFNELRARAGRLSQSVLVTRLGELDDADLVHAESGRYTLTARGSAVAAQLAGLAGWSVHETGDHALAVALAFEPPAAAREQQPELDFAEPNRADEPEPSATPEPSAAPEPVVEVAVEPAAAGPRPSPGNGGRPRPRPRPVPV